MVGPLWKILRRFLKKLKIEIPYDPTVSLLGIYTKKAKILTQKGTCTPMLIATLFTIPRHGSKPSVHQQMNGKKINTHTHTLKYYSTIKRMKFCHLQKHGWM